MEFINQEMAQLQLLVQLAYYNKNLLKLLLKFSRKILFKEFILFKKLLRLKF